MEDGGLFFWLIIFAVAVMQGIGQKKKKRGPMGPLPPGQKRQPMPRPEPGEAVEIDLEAALPDATRASGPAGSPNAGEKSSEGMIPQDVWAEILGLARGQPPKREPDPHEPSMDEIEAGTAPARPPTRREERTREVRPRPERSRAEAPTEVGRPREVRPREIRPERERTPASRKVPVSHTAAAQHHVTAPSEFETRLGVGAEEKSVRGPEVAQAGAAASPRVPLFGTGSTEELRKAIILQEVLGPPVGMRDE